MNRVHKIRHLALVFACVVSIISSISLASCSGGAAVIYQAPFVPIAFAIDTNGNVSVVLSAHLATPIGDFSVGAAEEQSIQPPAHGILLFIRHLLGEKPVDTGFKINEDAPDKVIVIDDDIRITFDGNIHSIEAIHRHRIVLMSAAATMPPFPDLRPTKTPTPIKKPTPHSAPPLPRLHTSVPAFLCPYSDCSLSAFAPIVINNTGTVALTWWASINNAGYWLVPSGGAIAPGSSITTYIAGPIPSPLFHLDVTITSNGGNQTIRMSPNATGG